MTTYRVTLQFEKDGPSSSGWWADLAVAERKFTAWLGTYGSLDGVLIQLAEETDDGRDSILKIWTKEHGETFGPA